MKSGDQIIFKEAGQIMENSGVVDQGNVEAALLFFSLYQDMYSIFMERMSRINADKISSYGVFLRETFSLTVKEIAKSGKLSSVTITMRIFFSFMRMPISEPLEEAIQEEEAGLDDRIAEIEYLIGKIVDMDGYFPVLCRVLTDYKMQLNHIHTMLAGMYGSRATRKIRRELRTHLIANLADFRKATRGVGTFGKVLKEETKRWIGVLIDREEFDLAAFRNPQVLGFYEGLDPVQQQMYQYELLYDLAGYQESDEDRERLTTGELARKLNISTFNCFFKRRSFRSKYRKLQAEAAQWLTQDFEDESQWEVKDPMPECAEPFQGDEAPPEDAESQQGDEALQEGAEPSQGDEALQEDAEPPQGDEVSQEGAEQVLI